jgi:membrane protein DedA with SNARE-associated domain
MSIETAFVSTLTTDIARLQPVLDRYGLSALFVACLVEGFGIPLPGQTLLIACAMLAAGGKLDIVSVLLTAWIATQLGDIIGYAIGRYGLQRSLSSAVKQGERLAKLERLFDRWGMGLLLIARFLDGIRQTSNLAAGALQMSWWRFLVATISGTSLWILTFGVGAFYLELDFHHIVDWLQPIKSIALIVTLALIGALGLSLFWNRRRQASDQQGDAPRR